MYKNLAKEMYLEGFNSSEISRLLNNKGIKVTKAAIQKYIQRNLKNLKYIHERKVIERREIIKATNYEAKRHMTDKAFIMKNRSIYKTKANGDIVLNKTIAPAVTWDTPRRLSNENKIS
ncbi:DNA-binding response regulator [Clostridium septicum]|uniref:DNA-binding response regulator n=2 Tax=Clostridium septicum TaxID=1504 RepID=A0ABY5B4Y3_CLOSE|nr:DNA-binding response regulator [Clostridium septicum]UEC19645.1 DNA-binding response regulator [Clostridium septicum]USS02294.1 DNA-binding response regulator [Clostridium septicum]